MKTLIGGTDKGLVRETNQDCFALSQCGDNLAFAVLCDGMGGENGGNVASKIASDHVQEVFRRELAEGLGESSLRGILLSAVTGANALVYEAAQKDPALAGMGTTMIAAVFLEDHMYLACVGDSRVYQVSPERERQISRDHTVVQMLLDNGEITAEDAAHHPKRHFITRAVGVAPGIDVDFHVQKLAEEEIVLLCSDGLYNYLQGGELYAALSRCVEDQSVQSLIDFALAAGGSDNVTAIVAKRG